MFAHGEGHNPATRHPFGQRRETVGNHRAGGNVPPASMKDER